MAEASRRAAARPSRGGHPNIVFVATGVEHVPPALDGLADRVTVRFPWGSLLGGALGLDGAVAAAIARLVAPDGRLEIVLSIVERDGAAVGRGAFEPADVEWMAVVYGDLGLDLTDARRLMPDEVRATGSTWARRLRTADRPVWRIGLHRPAPVAGAAASPPAPTSVGYPRIERHQGG